MACERSLGPGVMRKLDYTLSLGHVAIYLPENMTVPIEYHEHKEPNYFYVSLVLVR